MTELVAKALRKNRRCICKAIDDYIAKADEDLADALDEEGFKDGAGTVEVSNSLEDKVARALKRQSKKFQETVEGSDNLYEADDAIEDLDDGIAVAVAGMTAEMFREQIPRLANMYIKDSDSELVVNTIRDRTERWIESWSQRLGELMEVNTHREMSKVIENAISNGLTVDELAKQLRAGGWRSEYYQAKRVALTETLRAHSVAANEAMQQSPSVSGKQWIHTGAYVTEPRQNHLDMDDGSVIPKDEPFMLVGADGGVYYPMYPRDSELPPGESINCHCMVRAIVDEDILGMSLEEREAMQDEIVEDDGIEWDEPVTVHENVSVKRSDVTARYSSNAKPGSGRLSYDRGYKTGKHSNEISTAKWLANTQGGHVRLVAESKEVGVKSPDYVWNRKKWELKNVTTEKSADYAVRTALQQINGRTGGVILDYGSNAIDTDKLQEIITNRVGRSDIHRVDVMILTDDKKNMSVFRYKK